MYRISFILLILVPSISSVALYQQCGGIDYTGSTECDEPLKCFRRSEWYSSCRASCPGVEWECSETENNTTEASVDEPGAANWGQCGGQGWNGATWCVDYPCEPRSVWFSQCRPDCPPDWLCAEIPDEVIPEEELEEIETFNPDELEEEEIETDEFPDPSEVDLDALQQLEQAQLGIVDEEDPFSQPDPEEVPAEETEVGTTLFRRKRNAVRATACKANGKSGTCISTSSCKGTSIAGFCPGAKNIQCCIVSSGSKPSAGNSKPSGGSCGNYKGAAARSIKGNGNKVYRVVKIKQAHLANPGSFSLSPTSSDNTMTTATACAFDKMATAAKKAGVSIKIASGFRTIARQQYFWNCYKTKKCNGGNLAARPGTSNHGRGIALDLNTNCGKQSRARPNCGGSRVYQWLYKNAHKFGFTRTVKSEPWHWEFRGAGVRRASFS